jgi:hypothetical protein
MSRLAPTMLALAACAALLAACGGSPSGSGTATAAGASPEKFQQCLKDQGVEAPPQPGGDRTALRKATQACRRYAPRGGFGGPGRPNAAAFTPYLTCLKDKGLNVDPSKGFDALRAIDTSSTTFKTAQKACASKLPRRPTGPPPTGASPSSGTPS